jgi:hypothetical protein
MRRLLALALVLAASPAWADDQPPPIEVTLKDHHFSPAEIHLPAGKPAFLHVTNADETADEFEMRTLAIEKVLPPGGSVLIRIRPLGPGWYDFIGEFHQDTASGTIISE